MQFSCGQCSTRYAVPDEKVRGKRIRTKCRRCGAEILVEGQGAPKASLPPQAPPSLRAASLAPASALHEQPWTVALSRAERQKMTTAEFVEAIATGRAGPDTLVWKQGMAEWLRPFDVPAIAIALRARGLAPPGERAATEPRESAGPPPSDGPTALAPQGYGANWDDDEATQVIAPERAQELLAEETKGSRQSPQSRPPPKAAPKRPSPAPPRGGPAQGAPGATSSRPPTARSVTPPPKPARRMGQSSSPAPPARPAAPSGRSMPPRPAKGPGARPVPLVPLPAPVVPAPTPHTAPTPAQGTPAQPSAVNAEAALGFDDEATAVYEPDRARALLDAEAAKSLGAQNETPFAFGFDQTAPNSPPRQAVAPLPPPPIAPPMRAIPVVPVGPARREAPPPERPAPTAIAAPPMAPARPAPVPASAPPTVVVAEAPKPKSPLPPPPPAISTTPTRHIVRPAPSLQHEKTRVIRVRKKGSGPLFWFGLVVALAAAGAIGFYASQILQRHALPAWLKLP